MIKLIRKLNMCLEALELMFQRIESRTEQLEMRPTSQGFLPFPSIHMPGDELPMNHIEDPFRDVLG